MFFIFRWKGLLLPPLHKNSINAAKRAFSRKNIPDIRFSFTENFDLPTFQGSVPFLILTTLKILNATPELLTTSDIQAYWLNPE